MGGLAAQSALPDAHAIELAAALEEALADEAECAAGDSDGDSAIDDDEMEEDEYVRREAGCTAHELPYRPV